MGVKLLSHRSEGSRVERSAGVVRKVFAEAFDAELRKHRWCSEVFAQSGGAHYPKLIEAKGEYAGGTLVMEYLDGLVSLREPYLDFMKAKTSELSVFVEAGRALGLIHSAPPPASEYLPYPMSPLLLNTLPGPGSEGAVLMHGDFGFSNVYWSASRAQIVILDASPNHFVTHHPLQIGTRYADLANFVSCLCGLVPPSNFPSMYWTRAPRVISAFIEGYVETASFVPDPKTLFFCANETAQAYFAYSQPRGLHRMLARTWFRNIVKLIGRHYERL